MVNATCSNHVQRPTDRGHAQVWNTGNGRAACIEWWAAVPESAALRVVAGALSSRVLSKAVKCERQCRCVMCVQRGDNFWHASLSEVTCSSMLL